MVSLAFDEDHDLLNIFDQGSRASAWAWDLVSMFKYSNCPYLVDA
jgi:hypothetical protein